MPLKGHYLNIMEVNDVRLIRDHAAKARDELKRLVERLPPEYRSLGLNVNDLRTVGEIFRYVHELATILNTTWEARSGKAQSHKNLPSQHDKNTRTQRLPRTESAAFTGLLEPDKKINTPQNDFWDQRFSEYEHIVPHLPVAPKTKTLPKELVRAEGKNENS